MKKAPVHTHTTIREEKETYILCKISVGERIKEITLYLKKETDV